MKLHILHCHNILDVVILKYDKIIAVFQKSDKQTFHVSEIR